MTRISGTWLGRLPRVIRGMSVVAVLVCGLLFVSDASASVMNTLLTGSSGNMTISLQSTIFNNDPAALPLGTCTTTLGRGCNSDVANGTSLTFTGGPLATGEGIYINNNDLTLTPHSAADANTFLTFASHPNLVFSELATGPGSPFALTQADQERLEARLQAAVRRARRSGSETPSKISVSYPNGWRSPRRSRATPWPSCSS